MRSPESPRTFRSDLPRLVHSLWGHLLPKRKRQVVALACLMVISAVAEVVSLGAVLPFLGALMDPQRTYAHPLVSSLAQSVGIASAEQLVFPLTVAFIAASLFAGAIRVLLLWANTRLGFAAGADLGLQIYRQTLHQPYSAHIEKSSADVINDILNKVNGTVFGVLLPVLQLASSCVLLVAIMATLIAIDPLIAAIAALGFGGCYALISWRAREHLAKASRQIVDEQAKIIKAVQEGLGGIRDVLLDGTQSYYCNLYRRADQNFRRAQAANAFIAQSPRFLLEAVGIVLIASLAYGLSRGAAGVASALPVLGALALGAQRLLPALQQFYHAWTSVTGNQAALSDTVALLARRSPDRGVLSSEPLPFENMVVLKGVRFRHAGTTQWILDGIDFELPQGARVGVIGPTGSGKSTLMDVLMGLLTPTEGSMYVDGLCVTASHIASWRRRVAHVPQHIYLADGTIAENIAFGIAPGAIDMKRVEDAANKAGLRDFIDSRPNRFDEKVGERGIRLSGGQRQRIAIARALYKNASVLFFDEATSALDHATERSVMDAIDALGRELTIVVVAHRLSSLGNCDFIVKVENGKLSAAKTAVAANV